MPKHKEPGRYIGKSIPRLDGQEIVVGSALYAADHLPMGRVYAVTVYSGQVAATIQKVDVEKAKTAPGVLCVLTAGDLPAKKDWQNQQVLAQDRVRYEGDAVALIAAQSLREAQQAAQLVGVVCQPLPQIQNLAQAQAGAETFFENAPDNRIPHSHWQVRKRGGGEGKAAIRLQESYTTGYVEHMYIEPEAVLVVPEKGGLAVYAAVQSPFMAQDAVSSATGLAMNRIRICQGYVGGSFGGKNEGVAMLAARAAVLALALGRPVAMKWNRWESMIGSAKRHPMQLDYQVQATEEGRLLSVKADIKSEGGAYAAMTPYVNWRGVVHACGCYQVENAEVDICGYYTNRAMSGAFRGFSSPQIIFAQESLMDELARCAGISPLELRKRNALCQGDTTATGQVLQGPMVLREMLAHAGEKTGFEEKYAAYQNQPGARYRKGIGLAISYRGCGYGAETADATGAFLMIHKDGSVTVRSGLVDIGQGLNTVFCQIAAETLGVRIQDVRYENIDTIVLPDGNFTSASRGTFRGGKAVQAAAEILRTRLLQYAQQKLNSPPGSLRLEEGQVYGAAGQAEMSLGELATSGYYDGVDLGCWYWLPGEGVSWNHDTGTGDAYLTYTCSVVVTELVVDTKLGQTELERVYACHDSGRILNPALAKSQVTGGISMGLGMALTEQLVYREGRTQNASFHDYILPTTLDMPKLEVEFWETEDENGPFHAKSLGESSSEAVAASVANALANAVGIRFRALPITPQDILQALEETH